MKLLFVHQHLGEFGGAENNIHLTASELRRCGHTVALLYRNGTGRDETGWRQTFHECFCLHGEANVEVAEAVLDHFGPDLVYWHNLPDLKVFEALLAAGPPVVRMVHDHSLYCLRTYKYNYFTRHVCRRAASAYCVFPCLAPLTRDQGGVLPFKWASFAEKQKEIRLTCQCRALIVYSEYLKAELVGNGFDPARIELCVPIRLCTDERLVSSFSDRNIVLYAGQIIRGKGVDALLRALAKVKTPFHCIILGDGNHREYCERLRDRLGLAERVHFHGYLLPAELKAFYLEASVFVMSSLWPEPFGMAGPEAMRYGVPVVAFDTGGIREWLHDGRNGYLVPWNDTERFAARLDELLTDKARARELGRRALEGLQHYDASRQIARLEAIFQRVCHAPSHPTQPPLKTIQT